MNTESFYREPYRRFIQKIEDIYHNHHAKYLSINTLSSYELTELCYLLYCADKDQLRVFNETVAVKNIIPEVFKFKRERMGEDPTHMINTLEYIQEAIEELYKPYIKDAMRNYENFENKCLEKDLEEALRYKKTILVSSI